MLLIEDKCQFFIKNYKSVIVCLKHKSYWFGFVCGIHFISILTIYLKIPYTGLSPTFYINT